MAVLPLRVTVSVSVNSKVLLFCTVAELYRLNVTVSLLLGLTRPVTVALSAMDEPTVALAGVWLVLIVSMFTGSWRRRPLLTMALLVSPL